MVGTHLAEYESRFRNIALTRDDDGILLVQLHTEGSDFVWGVAALEELSLCWDFVARDLDNRAVILTGTDETFIHHEKLGVDDSMTEPETWWRITTTARRLTLSHLDIEVPVIAAVNGHATVHAEQALLADVVLCADGAVWAERPHFTSGLAPGDGVQVIFPLLMGYNRARYFLMMGQELSAAEAQNLGLVNEVLPRAEVVPRAFEIARRFVQKPNLTLRTTRGLLTAELRQMLDRNVRSGLAMESLTAMDYLKSLDGSWELGS